MKIMPFKGILYNTAKIDLAEVVTLPYDKITPELKEDYLSRSPYNAARIILSANNQESAELWQQWLRTGILLQDADPAIYLYQQQFTYPEGTKRLRTGIVVLLEVQPYGQDTVMPHEKTFARIRAEREALLTTCQANFGHVFMLYSDSENQGEKIIGDILKQKPRLAYQDDAGVIHRLWAITAGNIIKRLEDFFAKKRLFIADGHHRYGAALDYKEKQQELLGDRYTGREGFNYRMVTLVNVDSDGVVILPTHRVIKGWKQFDREQFLVELEKYFFIVENNIPGAELIGPWLANIRKQAEKHSLGMYLGGNHYYLLTLKPEISLADILGINRSPVWLYLDVNILHLLILKNILNIDSSVYQDEGNILYLRDPYEAIDWVKKNKQGLAFILNPTKVDEVKDIVSLAEVMPHKSTDFYPKLNTGLVMRRLEEVADCSYA